MNGLFKFLVISGLVVLSHAALVRADEKPIGKSPDAEIEAKRLAEEAAAEIAEEQVAEQPAPTLGDHVAAYAESRRRRRVGSGQCTSLAAGALSHVGAWGGNFGRTPYVWGRKLAKDEPILPGDIVQFEGCGFNGANGWISFPHHTAVIKAAEGKQVTMLHQNFNGNTTVQQMHLNLGSKTRGYYVIYRPLAK